MFKIHFNRILKFMGNPEWYYFLPSPPRIASRIFPTFPKHKYYHKSVGTTRSPEHTHICPLLNFSLHLFILSIYPLPRRLCTYIMIHSSSSRRQTTPFNAFSSSALSKYLNEAHRIEPTNWREGGNTLSRGPSSWEHFNGSSERSERPVDGPPSDHVWMVLVLALVLVQN